MKILFASDLNFYYYKDFTGEIPSPEVLFQEVRTYFDEADFSVLNMESVFGNEEELTRIRKVGPNIISRKEFLPYAEYFHPTVFNFANNHCGDFGDGPLFETLDYFRSKGYTVIGAGKNLEEAYLPAVFEKDGVKVAVIGVGENEFGVATKTKAGLAGYKLGLVTKAISDARADGCLPIIYFHGGNEFNPMPSPGKVELYRHFIDIGAAAVIAMHTHCPQPYEYYKNGCIVYSMGNFFFPKSGRSLYPPPAEFKKTWFYGYMAQLDIDSEGCRLSIVPYNFDYTYLSLLKGEELEEFNRYMDFLNTALQDEDAVQAFFDGWSVRNEGVVNTYLSKEFFTPDGEDKVRRAALRLKSNICIETVHELNKNVVDILYWGRLEAAKEKVAQIKRLQNLEL